MSVICKGVEVCQQITITGCAVAPAQC